MACEVFVELGSQALLLWCEQGNNASISWMLQQVLERSCPPSGIKLRVNVIIF